MRPLVSIIVPVFNVDKYLVKCLESLVNQSLNEIEIIIVNDGSTDGSQAIIDDFVCRYPQKIVSFIKKNGGLSDARNFGLRHAQAEYIGFIDSDDFVDLDMYRQMLKKAISSAADVVVCDITYEWENEKLSTLMKGLRQIKGLSEKRSAMLSPLFAWNKLYHKKFFEQYQLRYPVGLWYEDILVTLPIYTLANHIAYVEVPFVHYLQRKSSIMSAKNPEKMRDIFVIMSRVHDYFKDYDLLETYKIEIEYLFVEQLLVYGGFRFIRSNQPFQLFNEAMRLTHSFFPHWRKNPYIKTLSLKNQVYTRTLNKHTYKVFLILTRTLDLLKGRR